MSIIHLTNGDVAAESLRAALAEAGRDDRVHALRDDLAVGPLRGIDDGPDVRAEFWDRVSTDTRRDFLREFREQAAALENIARSEANLVVWHGESSADQLMLRRVCYHLRNSPQRLNEVRLSIRDLTDPGAWAHSRKDRATSVGMFAPEAKHANGETRRWRDNTFTSGSFTDLDALILEQATGDWQPAARVAAELMTADLGYLVSDSIVLWRFRELASTRRIKLRGDAGAWRTLEMCAALAPCPH
ncbi:DUF1835 domain-containing protein [Paraburkholderia fungorum]|uniref:DUF1835 domain-containing protein n=1 Tax=Paraburkholderia fungorum TaxID=134537 RepID=UPI000DB79915|nr:DUF1835 domain-containing protein [Paraburkholderia fungorum]PZR38668.1 MAG: hypothetical protein DI523_37940 [Paraburkholderia fungorum]